MFLVDPVPAHGKGPDSTKPKAVENHGNGVAKLRHDTKNPLDSGFRDPFPAVAWSGPEYNQSV
jgi:hypothetical protein